MTSRTVTRIGLLSIAILAGPGPGHRTWLGPARARAQDDGRSGDREAIHAVMKSFVKAFESGDAAAVAGHWTAEGEYVGEDGSATRGREALEKAYGAFFAKHPKVEVEAAPGPIRFVSRDAAIDEGTVKIRKDATGGAVAARYNILFVREDGRWRIAHLSETTVEGDGLDDLAWLVGEWKSSGEETEVTTSYAWNERKTFLKVRFTIKEKDRTLGGDQFLGVDPATGAIRSWTFESEGGIGEATWSRDGDRWVVESVGTLADGGLLVATNILTKVDDDTFTWQSIDRTLDDEPLPDLAPVKVTRVKAR